MRATVDTNIFNSILISRAIIDKNLYSFQTYAIPLYLYPETTAQQTNFQSTDRTPNLNAAIVNEIAEGLRLEYTTERVAAAAAAVGTGRDLSPHGRDLSPQCDLSPQRDSMGTGRDLSLPKNDTHFAPIDILDYIYAVLHSPTYREKYKEFLKIDFPRVPYPKDQDTFWQLVKLGGEIRQIHLLESPVVENYITQYPIDGNNEVTKPNYQNGKVYINETQYFDNVPQLAWEFYIGGYQPAQKWLKDRKERKLEFDDILHYQKIIVALSETDRLMKEIDKIIIE